MVSDPTAHTHTSLPEPQTFKRAPQLLVLLSHVGDLLLVFAGAWVTPERHHMACDAAAHKRWSILGCWKFNLWESYKRSRERGSLLLEGGWAAVLYTVLCCVALAMRAVAEHSEVRP